MSRPKAPRNSVISINPSEYVMQCEWMDCSEVFNNVHKLTLHLNDHLAQFITERNKSGEPDSNLPCQWRDCNIEVEGAVSDFLRHAYFHTFHVKIKCIGELLLEKSERPCCGLGKQSRNLIPELPECLECGWEHCHLRYENAEIFYRHVELHADNYPEGNNVKNGCRCLWEGCESVFKSRHKLKDHLRSHTQEKLVACPTCGALFSTRTKFFDHLDRQLASVAGTRYQCSHCSRLFAAERLLRDHMRNHVNQYKCPYCDMTSPFPANLRVHIKYRHSDEKPFKCDICDYSGKVMADLRKHLDIHNNPSFACQVEGCTYTARAYQSLANHFKKSHQSDGEPRYQCHLCSSRMQRGSLLTKHLKNQHTFNWPSGHSRFRYRLHSDGLWRLQTVRYGSGGVEVHGDSTSDVVEETESALESADEDSLEAISEAVHDEDSLGCKENLEVNPENAPIAGVCQKGTKFVDNASELLDTLRGVAELSGISTSESDEQLPNEFDSCKESEDAAGTHAGHLKRKLSESDLEHQEIDKKKKRKRSISNMDTNGMRKDNADKGNGKSSKQHHLGKKQLREKENTPSHSDSVNKPIDNWTENSLEELVASDGEDEKMDEACVTIQIVKNKDGQYMVRTEDSVSGQPVTISMPDGGPAIEENMYNLQMLGDVALQKR